MKFDAVLHQNRVLKLLEVKLSFYSALVRSTNVTFSSLYVPLGRCHTNWKKKRSREKKQDVGKGQAEHGERGKESREQLA